MRIPGGRFLDDEGCASLHAAALRVLAEVGVEVRAERALGLLEGAGADVSGTRVRMRAALIEEALVSVPRSFVLHGRAADGSLDLDVRLGATYFGNGTDCLNFLDPRTGERRRATLADVETTASVVERLPNIDFVMDGVLPEDVPLDKLDLAQFAAMVKNTRKPVVSSSANGGETLALMCEMAGLAGRADSFACLAMSNPPLILDAVCATKAMTAAEMGIPLILGPGHSMGATAPASIAGGLVLAHAECLAAMVLHQLAAPGAPFLYGTGAGALDMRTMADVWCAPEGALGDLAGCDLAAWLGLPSWSYAGSSDSKILDEQLSSELATGITLAALSSGTLFHDMGEYESGVLNGVESVVLADALAGYARRLLDGISVTDETLQLDDIGVVGPGGDFLGRPYTRAHYREVWQSPLFDTSLHDRWEADGSTTLGDRLRSMTLELLETCAPVVEPDTGAEIDRLWTAGC